MFGPQAPSIRPLVITATSGLQPLSLLCYQQYHSDEDIIQAPECRVSDGEKCWDWQVCSHHKYDPARSFRTVKDTASMFNTMISM
ncbi:hypothetical protein E2C01_013297 [Portunus trituberculatus]|uniref:Uncharacterized protein n=1 Tax=Portunus trituberculatus TaxID=210409 RepID=A0A5B7DGW7_PORTR|nr:hypothetical protein [Portunus trituberculatus]